MGVVDVARRGALRPNRASGGWDGVSLAAVLGDVQESLHDGPGRTPNYGDTVIVKA